MNNKYNILLEDSESETIIKEDIIEKSITNNDIKTNDNINKKRQFYINKEKEKENLDNNTWTTYKYKKKNINISTNNNIKKKTFDNTIRTKTNIKLPEYYQKRTFDNTYEIPQYEASWIKKIGGLEKSDSTESMFKGIIIYAISYFENSSYMNKNVFFVGKKSLDNEELLELILIQTFSILFHRAIKSDSLDIIKIILNNIPNYRIISGNPLDNTPLSNTLGAMLYKKIKIKWINLNRNLMNAKKNNNIEKVNEYNNIITNIEKTWIEYILQSIWNGNNPIHDCLYYGSSETFSYILEYCYEKNLHNILNNMLIVPNGLGETHKDIVYKGRKTCENETNFIIRNLHFNKCEFLYNKTIEILDKQNFNINENNINIIDIFINKDDDIIFKYLSEYIKTKQKEIIIKTLNIWNDLSKNDESLLLYFNNIKTKYKLYLLYDDDIKYSEMIDSLTNIEHEFILNEAKLIFIKQNINDIIVFILNIVNNNELIKKIFMLWDKLSSNDEDLTYLLDDIKNSVELKEYVNILSS